MPRAGAGAAGGWGSMAAALLLLLPGGGGPFRDDGGVIGTCQSIRRRSATGRLPPACRSSERTPVSWWQGRVRCVRTRPNTGGGLGWGGPNLLLLFRMRRGTPRASNHRIALQHDHGHEYEHSGQRQTPPTNPQEAQTGKCKQQTTIQLALGLCLGSILFSLAVLILGRFSNLNRIIFM